MNFETVRNEHCAARLIDKESGRQYGEFFQETCRSMEWKSAGIIYDKYKRKYNLEHKDLIDLQTYAGDLTLERQKINKPIKQDFLIQKLSEYIKTKNSN